MMAEYYSILCIMCNMLFAVLLYYIRRRYGGMENPCLTFVTPTLLAGDCYY